MSMFAVMSFVTWKDAADKQMAVAKAATAMKYRVFKITR